MCLRPIPGRTESLLTRLSPLAVWPGRLVRVCQPAGFSWWLACVALLLYAVALPARADMWGYVDGSGVAHFSAERLDDRYELFFKGDESFTAGKGQALPGGRSAGQNRTAESSPPGKTSAPPKLLAYFDISPNYKAVKQLLRDASELHGIDYELLQALIATESGFDTHAVSPKGAVGLMQLIAPTAARYGVRADKRSPIEKKLTDPGINIRAGSRYLSDLIEMFPGQLELAVAAYNAGEGAVQRAGNKIPNYPETRNYVKTVMQLYALLKPVGLLPDAPRTPGRVRMEMMGGASGRGNLPPGSASQQSEAAESPTPASGSLSR